MRYVKNPAYEKAKYEYALQMSDGTIVRDPLPCRGNHIKDGQIIDYVPPYVPEVTSEDIPSNKHD